jgi:hypothetical protein
MKHFLKNARLPPLRSLLLCAFLTLPSAYDPQGSANPSPTDPLASPNSKGGASDARALVQRREWGALSDWSPEHLSPTSREGREWGVAPAVQVCTEKPPQK